MAVKPKKNRKYYRKCSNNFDADFTKKHNSDKNRWSNQTKIAIFIIICVRIMLLPTVELRRWVIGKGVAITYKNSPVTYNTILEDESSVFAACQHVCETGHFMVAQITNASLLHIFADLSTDITLPKMNRSEHFLAFDVLMKSKLTVGSKIIRALEIVRVKKLIPNAVLWNKWLPRHDL